MGDQFTTADGIKYEITSPHAVKVVEYTSTAKEVAIDFYLMYLGTGFEVTAIGHEAFTGKPLTGVTFSTPSNVTRIGVDAFWKNQLTSIEIPKSVTSPRQRAFGNNQLGGSVTIPNGVTKIEMWAFSQNDLKELIIPASVGSIRYQAFFTNQNLTQVAVERNPPTTFDPTAFQSSFPNHAIRKELVGPLVLKKLIKMQDGQKNLGSSSSPPEPLSLTALGTQLLPLQQGQQ